MKEVQGFKNFEIIKPVLEGFQVKEYFIEISNGERLLLRISDISELERYNYVYGFKVNTHNLIDLLAFFLYN